MPTADVDLESLSAWIGRSETASSFIAAEPLRRLAATLDCEADEWGEFAAVPPLWHWAYFLPHHPTRELGEDGHAQRGGFLPPVALPRRMWAGGRIEFRRPLAVGGWATRVSTIESVEVKQGRSGTLVFVTVRHEIAQDDLPAIVEYQDLVYREFTRGLQTPAGALGGRLATEAADFTERRIAGDALLFRYSALTFNSHRIHYDRRYATENEGYPGLVVHGPLIATLLALTAVRHRRQASAGAPAASAGGHGLAHFSFRGEQPLFDGEAFSLCARDEAGAVRLWAADAAGRIAMQASAKLAGEA